MFGRVKKPVPPALPAPELDSTPEYVELYNSAWEDYYTDQAVYENKRKFQDSKQSYYTAKKTKLFL